MMRNDREQRVGRILKKATYRRRESELAIMLSALRVCESRARVVAARQALAPPP